MQLVVARGDPPLGVDQIRAVGDARLVELDGERADVKKDAELAGERSEPRKRRASFLGLRRLDHELGLSSMSPVFSGVCT